jgi:DNA ligase (NAD+)
MEIATLKDLGLFESIISNDEVSKPKSGISGFVFCITGTMKSGSREQVEALIEKHGGIAKGSVGKKTNFLVQGEAGGLGKATAAAKYGTTIITEEQLYEILGVAMPQVRDASLIDQ